MKRNKCASLGTCFWDLYSLNTSSKATRWSFYSVLLTNKFQQHFNNNKKNRRQLLYDVYDLLGENQRQRKWNEWCLPVLSFVEFKGIYSFAENKYKRWIQAYIYFFNSVLNSAVCRPPLVDWQLLTPEKTFGLLADKEGGMTVWKQISPVFLPFSLFSSLFFSRSLPSRRTPLSERLEQASFNRNRKL